MRKKTMKRYFFSSPTFQSTMTMKVPQPAASVKHLLWDDDHLPQNDPPSSTINQLITYNSLQVKGKTGGHDECLTSTATVWLFR
jgi:hypothetical protein